MTKWSQKKSGTPKRVAHKALSGVLNGHITKSAVRRLARKGGASIFKRQGFLRNGFYFVCHHKGGPDEKVDALR